MNASASIPRGPDLALARLHLRLGSLALARAELETLAGRDALDEDGLVDLAEARWRSGDIAGAGEAAVAALTDEEGPLLALVVAAEAAIARGRPTEARRLAAKAMTAASGSIDAIFAGMPRGPSWPPDAAAPPPAPTTMFDAPKRGALVTPHAMRRVRTALADDPDAPVSAGTETDPSDAADAGTVGLWGEDVLEAEAVADLALASDRAATDPPDAGEALELGRAALAAHQPDAAAIHLGLVLRLSPMLAPAVLDLVVDRAEPGLALVRGDAYRLVGRELDARRAFGDAARAVGAPPDSPAEPAAPAEPRDVEARDAEAPAPDDESHEGDPG
jgi:hypothetical protein